MVTYTDYSKKGEEAVLDRASSLTGKSFQSISKLSPYPKDELNKKNKGNLVTLLSIIGLVLKITLHQIQILRVLE